MLKPLVVSCSYESEALSGSSFIDLYEWSGARDIAAFRSVPAAIEFQTAHDWEAVRAACHELLGKVLYGITQITGLPPFYPNNAWYAHVATAPLPPEVDIVQLKSCLYHEYRIEVPLIDWNGRKLMRVSIQGLQHTARRGSFAGGLIQFTLRKNVAPLSIRGCIVCYRPILGVARVYDSSSPRRPGLPAGRHSRLVLRCRSPLALAK